MTTPALNIPVKVLRSATAGRRPGDGTYRALTDGELFVNTQDRVLCYLSASGALLTVPFDPAFFASLAPLASPALTGTPTAPTQGAGDNSTNLATTAFVAAVTAALAPLASPTLTGSPKAPTPASGDSSTLVATTAFVAAAIAALVNSSPAALDTLKELADALGDDPNYAATTATALGLRLRVDAAQSLTAAQQATARGNLGLAGRTARGDANYTILATDRMVAVTALSAARTFTLPAASAYPTGVQLVIKDESGSATSYAITVAVNGSDTIDGASSATIGTSRGYIILESNGSNGWGILASLGTIYRSNIGYKRDPDGSIRQWGTVSANGDTAVTFPIAFPNTCTVAVATVYGNGGSGTAYAVTVDQVTASSFAVRPRSISGSSVGGTNVTVLWEAQGF